MPKDYYTLLILPQKQSAVKKICLSSMMIKGASLFIMFISFATMYCLYDYIHIRREHGEMARLKQKTVEQRIQIQGLVARVEQVAGKMEELEQVDKKIRIMADLVKGKHKEQWLGIGGPVSAEQKLRTQIENDDRAMIADVDLQINRLMDEALTREKSLTDLLAILKKKQSIMAATPSIWPVRGWVTSEFGWRTSPFSNGREFHKGIDIAANRGRPIRAPADGVVVEVDYKSDAGRMIQLDHGHGISTFYAHLSRSVVKPGQKLRRGERIGYVGNTGRSTGSHLHYAVILNGVHVNPRKYLN